MQKLNEKEKDMYDFAYRLLHNAGMKLKNRGKDGRIKVMKKTSHADLVTEDDIFVEKYLIEEIKEKYREHHIISEEGIHCLDRRCVAYTWIIDPIDGTTNYFRFGKDYAISLALYKEKRPVFGLVYDVAKEVVYGGKGGEGAWMNEKRQYPLLKKVEKLNESVAAISLRTIKELTNYRMNILDMLSRAQAYRYLGCASLEICKVANGEYDLFISSNVYIWDIAAAQVYIEEMGGFILSYNKNPEASFDGKFFVAAFRSPGLWNEVSPFFPEQIKEKLANSLYIAD
ncbi:MAG: inositol monophosphatase [Thermotaleaceae bacterium]